MSFLSIVSTMKHFILHLNEERDVCMIHMYIFVCVSLEFLKWRHVSPGVIIIIL